MAFGRCFPFVAPSIGIFVLVIVSSLAEKAPYNSFAKDATSASTSAGHYDYIVIGGGTAGCALAATLSASAKVPLLERGGMPYGNPNITHQSGLVSRFYDTSSPDSAAQLFLSKDGVWLSRARVLGGGSAINLGFYSRASGGEVVEAGWDPHLVNQSYMWVERKLTFRPKTLLQWQAAVKDGLVEAGVVPYNGGTYEHLVGTKIGNSIFDENGYRHSAADLLEYADDTKITLYYHALVHKILFKTPSLERKPRAYGVFFKDSKGNGHTAFLNGGPDNEIILSAGVFGSPQLLMLSGVGPSDHLKAHGNYIETVSGLSLVPEAIKVLMQAGVNMSFPDMKTQGGFLFSKVNKTFSQGHMELRNKDPNENPMVTFNYFQDSRDLKTCVRGMEVIRKVFESESFSSLRNPSTTFESLLDLVSAIPINERPKHRLKTASLEQFCMDNVITLLLFHGGCRVDSVVDHDYKVIGIDALRVIDGSTFSSSPGTNLQATVMMLGRRFNLEGFITGEKTSAGKDDVEWLQLDALIQGWILSTVNDEVSDLIISSTTSAADLWKAIHNLFHDNKAARAMQLEHQFYNTIKGTSTIQTYCQTLQNIADWLDDVDAPLWFPFFAPSLGILLLIIVSSLAEKAPYNSFAKDATLASASAGHYDYIVIGGGTAGCALAATLSGSAKVLLLERGGMPYDNPSVTRQSDFLNIFFDTSPGSAAQPFVSTDGVRLTRARILGGGSAINVGFYSRASKEEVSDEGWDPHLVNQSYAWVERKVTFRPKRLLRWQTAVRDGLHIAADLLEYADDSKITLYFQAVVHQILFKRPSSGGNPTAYGIFFKDLKGNGHMVFLNEGPNNEIILSAGAIGSPQLLMLSGIGPFDHLKAHGIDVILDQQMVGQGMADNPLNGIIIPSIRPTETSFSDVVGITRSGNYIETLSGLPMVPKAIEILRQAGFEDMSFPDMKLQGGIMSEKVNKIFSQGHMELKNRDPNDNPMVTFNYFQDSRDLQTCVRGMEVIKKVFESESFASLRNPSTSFESLLDLMSAIPFNMRQKNRLKYCASLEDFCVDNVLTMWHFHGGCRVDSVVDRDYKVIGVDALRVDGSMFSSSPGTNPQATVMMFGR
ncbi:unnamed protein product [Cuscuta campestris]|uniref:Glucose-methanol-choline oxidoreductase N-terminal domain-containing protein n=1 Tax=Cuscuta campestris TaxID=132261 RepID=A0A484MVY1_9ASTE|nr:unnamed protein product [Cuscuta campestris]